MHSLRTHASVFGLLLSTTVLHASETNQKLATVHLTKTQKQIQQYVTETLTELGIASENSEFLDPREAIGLSKKANKKWTVLKLLEAQTTNRTANDHALHVFGDRMKEMRTERRTQINNLIAGLNEVFHRNLTNQSVSRALGIRLIDFFNDQHVEHDCDETLQQSSKNFLDLVNKNFHSPAFKLPYEAKDLKRLSVLYYYPDYEPGVEEPDDWCDDLEFLSTHLDLNSQTLTLTGDYQLLTLTSPETLYQLMESVAIHCLRNGKQEQTFTGMISDTGNAGTLAISGGSHVLNTEAGSVVQNLNLTGGELTLGQDGNGHLNASNVQVASGVLALGRNSTEAAIATFALDAADEVTTQEISSHGSLTVRDQLEIGEGGVLKVGREEATGDVTVTGTTTNNGRLEIYKTSQDQIVSLQNIQGAGVVYMAPGTKMTIAGMSGNEFDFSNDITKNVLQFDGSGDLSLGENLKVGCWSGEGTLNSLNIAEGGYGIIGRSGYSKVINITSQLSINSSMFFGFIQPGQETDASQCDLNCGSITVDEKGELLVFPSPSFSINCLGECSVYGVIDHRGENFTTKRFTLNGGELSITFESFESSMIVQEEMFSSENSRICLSGGRDGEPVRLSVGGVLTHNGTMDIEWIDKNALILGGLEGTGTINLKDTTNPMTINFTRDCTFTGQIVCIEGATATLNLRSETPVTFTWPQRKLFTGTVNTDETLTVRCPAEFDLNGKVLTLTGNAKDKELFPTFEQPGNLDESTTLGSLTTTPGQSVYWGTMSDTGNTGTLEVAGGTHVLNTEADSSVQTLNVSGGHIVIGSEATGTLATSNVSVQDGVLGVGSVDHADSNGHLTVSGNLEIGENGVVKIGGGAGKGILSVAGTTTNNGRLEINKTEEGQVVNVGIYEGQGETYLSSGTQFFIKGDSGAIYSGNFDGNGDVTIELGRIDSYQFVCGGTVNSLTQTSYALGQFTIESKESLEIKEALHIGSNLIIKSEVMCGRCECASISIDGTNARLTCSEDLLTGDLCVNGGGNLTASVLSTTGYYNTIGYNSAPGVSSILVQDSMSCSDLVIGDSRYPDTFGKLVVGGVLSVTGTINVSAIQDDQSFVVGGLEGKGTINLATYPMTINFTQDCTFAGPITGTGVINLHSETPVTFTWPQRKLFTGTLNKDDTVTILTPLFIEPLFIAAEETYTLKESKTVLYIKSNPNCEATLDFQSNELTLVGGNVDEDDPTFYGKMDNFGKLTLAGNQQNLDTVEGSNLGSLTVSGGTLTLGSNQNGYLSSNDFYVEPEGIVVLGTVGGAEGHLTVGLHVSIDGQVKLLNGTLTTQPDLSVDGHFSFSGSIYVGEQSTFAFNLDYVDVTFDGQITGSGTVSLISAWATTFLWPQRKLFTGTVNKDDNVTILCPEGTNMDLNSNTLTLTGNEAHQDLITTYDNPVTLNEATTAKTLTQTTGQAIYEGALLDTGHSGTLAITGGSHILNTTTESSVQDLRLTGGVLEIGGRGDGTLIAASVSVTDGTLGVGSVDDATSKGNLTVSGNLDISENGVVKIGNGNGEGVLSVAGTTTNNGRLEIYKTGEDQVVKFHAYNGNGVTYIAEGATMSVEFDAPLETYSGSFEGRGHLITLGERNGWVQMGGGTLGKVTISGWAEWSQAEGAAPLTILNELKVNSRFHLGMLSPCTVVCGCLTLADQSECLLQENSQLICESIEGTGSIRVYNSLLTINLKNDCTFPGKIVLINESTATLNLHSETPVTFTWPQRSSFTGTVNKDDNVTIKEA